MIILLNLSEKIANIYDEHEQMVFIAFKCNLSFGSCNIFFIFLIKSINLAYLGFNNIRQNID